MIVDRDGNGPGDEPMGWDVAAGLILLWSALRGYFHGFLVPALKLSALIGSVYLAGPVRDFALPHVQPYFTAIAPATFAKMLWWAGAFGSYLVVAFVACGSVGLVRKRIERGAIVDPKGREVPGGPRPDRALGLVFGSAKGALVVALLSGLVLRYESKLSVMAWADDLLKTSQAIAIVRDHDPIGAIWNAPPVVRYRDHVYREGWFQLAPSANDPPVEDEEAGEEVKFSGGLGW